MSFSLKHGLCGISLGCYLFSEGGAGVEENLGSFRINKLCALWGNFTTTLTVEDFVFLQIFETCKDEEEIQAAKDMVATAKQPMTNDPASMPDGGS